MLRTRDERGFSLMEAVVATAIAVLAVLGLAHTFGLGQGLITRYELARAALAEAAGRMDSLAVIPPERLAVPGSGSETFTYEGHAVGESRWELDWRDDAADGLGGADASGDTLDLRQARVEVRWSVGLDADRIELVRLLPAR